MPDLVELRVLLEQRKDSGWVTISTELLDELLKTIESKPDYEAAIVNWPMPSA